MSPASVAVCVSTQVAACCSVTMCMRTRTAADDMTVFGTDGVMVPLDTFFQSASAVLVWHEDQPTAYVLTSRGAFQVRLHGTGPDLRNAGPKPEAFALLYGTDPLRPHAV